MEEVCCPCCGEFFPIPVPPEGERPAQMDYDCEVCCRPFVLVIDRGGHAEARGSGEGFGQ